MYAAPTLVPTEVHAVLPDHLRKLGHASDWLSSREAPPAHSFLEGPAFDRQGNFYCVDIPFGRIFRVSPAGDWTVFAHYDGEPNGLKIHRDGRIFVADAKLGLLAFDPTTGERSVVHDRPQHERFRGLNDLTFAANGDLDFTDMGQSSLQKPNGRVFRLRANGQLDLLIDCLAGPNGLVLDHDEKVLYVACTYWNAIVRIPLKSNGSIGKAGIHIRLSGSPTGPDGLAVDAEGNLAVVHAGFGTVWVFSRMGEPLYRLQSCAGLRTTNVTYSSVVLYITEAEHGVILKAKLPVVGKPMYSHL
jgi:gluconolactonase